MFSHLFTNNPVPSKIQLVGSKSSTSNYLFFKDLDALRLSEYFEVAHILSNNNWNMSPFPHFQAYKIWYAYYLADLGLGQESRAYVENTAHLLKAFPQPCAFMHKYVTDRLIELDDRLNVTNNTKETSAKGNNFGWIPKISSVSIGKSLEQLMNSAVGVENNQETKKGQSSLFPIPEPKTFEGHTLEPAHNDQINSSYYDTTQEMHTIHQQTTTQYYPQLQPYGEFNQANQEPSSNLTYSDYDHSQNIDYQSYTNETMAYSEEYHQVAETGYETTEQYYGVDEMYSQENNSVPTENVKEASAAPTLSPKPSSFNANQNITSSNLAPSYVPPPVPTSYKSENLPNEDEEDLGFGNTALKPTKPAPQETEVKQEYPSENASQNVDKSKSIPEKDSKKPESKGFFGSVFSLFGGKKEEGEGPTKAHLPTGSSFYYDPDLKKWVNKKGGSEKAEEKLAPPPVITPAKQSNQQDLPNGPLNDGITPQKAIPDILPPTEGGKNTKRKGARSRYVDVMNPNSKESVMPALTSGFMPSFQSATSNTQPQMMMVKSYI
jgi:hypothetical protein